MTIDVYQPDSRQITVDLKGRQITFAFNPDTGYALVPASVYGAEPETMNALRQSGKVNGIFNHEAINEI